MTRLNYLRRFLKLLLYIYIPLIFLDRYKKTIFLVLKMWNAAGTCGQCLHLINGRWTITSQQEVWPLWLFMEIVCHSHGYVYCTVTAPDSLFGISRKKRGSGPWCRWWVVQGMDRMRLDKRDAFKAWNLQLMKNSKRCVGRVMIF